MCNGVVRFMLHHDRAGTMLFAPLDGEYARGVFARHPGARTIDSVVFVETVGSEERLHLRSDAVIALAAYVGWPWRAARALRVVPRAVRDAGYDFIARIRHRVLRRTDACPLPPAPLRDRFLR